MKMNFIITVLLGLTLVMLIQTFTVIKKKNIMKLSPEDRVALKNAAMVEDLVSREINLDQRVESEDKEIELLEIVSENQLTVIQLISFDSCSTCRESSVYRWKDVYNESQKRLPIIQVISEGRLISQPFMDKLFLKAKALSDIPVYIDRVGDFVVNLNLEIDDLPVILFIDRVGRVLWVHIPHEFNEEEDRSFSRLVKMFYDN